MSRFFLTLFVLLLSLNSFSQKSNAGINIDIKYARFHFVPSLVDSFLSANVTYYFKVVSTGDSVYFDFAGNMTTDSVFFNGNKLGNEEFYLTQDFLVVKTGSLNAGDMDSVTVYYHGYPGDYPHQAYFLATQESNDTVPVLWTLSEPYGAMTWYPCKQNLSDKIDSIDVYITHPAGYTAVSNGMLVGDYFNGNDFTAHWHHSYPIETYLIAIAVSKYYNYSYAFVDTVSNDTFPIENFIYPDQINDTSNIKQNVNEFMQFYCYKFGRYPFRNEKYGQLVCGITGGMEHQTITFLNNITNFELVSHELAHQWFGDYITCKSWQDIWLNEGFATYLTGLCYENLAPQYWLPWKDLTMRTVFLEPGGSVFCDDTTDVERIFDGRLSYRKGAYLLHMLRWTIGDSAFFAGIRNYLSDTALAYGYATTDDLKHYLEVAGDTDLTEFFNDWYYGQGYPEYDITWTADSGILQIDINQGWSYEQLVFDITLPLVVWCGGQDTVLLVEMHDYNKSVSLPFNQTVDSIRFDPDLWILAPHNDVVHSYSDIVQDDNLKIWPVPFNQYLYVESAGVFDVEILNSVGKSVFVKKNCRKIEKINTARFFDDVYVIKITDDKGNEVVRKVLKMN